MLGHLTTFRLFDPSIFVIVLPSEAETKLHTCKKTTDKIVVLNCKDLNTDGIEAFHWTWSWARSVHFTSILLMCPQVLCFARDHDPCFFSSLKSRPVGMLGSVSGWLVYWCFQNQSAFFSMKKFTESVFELLDPDDDDDEGCTILWNLRLHSLTAWLSWRLGSSAHCSDSFQSCHFSHHIFIHFVTGLSVFLCHTWLPVVWSNFCEVQRIKYIILFMQVDSGWPDQPNYPRDVAAWWFKCGSEGTQTSDRSTEIDSWLTNGTKLMDDYQMVPNGCHNICWHFTPGRLVSAKICLYSY